VMGRGNEVSDIVVFHARNMLTGKHGRNTWKIDGYRQGIRRGERLRLDEFALEFLDHD